jgi:hypothetical protein
MKTILLILVIANLAVAGPAVKRKGPSRSPKHAEAVRVAGRAFSPAGGDVATRLPMVGYSRETTNSQWGKTEFIAEAMAPANQSVLFEYSMGMPSSGWTTLAWFGSYPKAQQVFAMVISDEKAVFIRATANVSATAGLAPVMGTPAIRTNPAVKSAQAWRGRR